MPLLSFDEVCVGSPFKLEYKPLYVDQNSTGTS